MTLYTFKSPCCDWLTLRHDYPVEREVEPRHGGLVMKVTPDGEIEWESPSWEVIKSNDTSLRVRCDGRRLWASANIGRFQRPDNRQGLTVMQCVDRWAEVLDHLGYDLHGFGSIWRTGDFRLSEWGTHITRVDLAGNHWTSNYAALSQSLMVRRLGQRLPQLGKYGPTWGYDSKRGNWMKAKLYDKDAELAGKRRSDGGATTARFEVQLGSEWLKRNGMDTVAAWAGDEDMGSIIYGKFAEQLFCDRLEVQRWADLPPRLQHWATCWREGRDLRSEMKIPTYYRVRKQLMEYGIDIGTPCNVLALTRHVQVVEVTPLDNLITLEAVA